jgi:hypothetical protein
LEPVKTKPKRVTVAGIRRPIMTTSSEKSIKKLDTTGRPWVDSAFHMTAASRFRLACPPLAVVSLGLLLLVILTSPLGGLVI